MPKPQTKRSLNIDADVHQEIKVTAAQRNVEMGELIKTVWRAHQSSGDAAEVSDSVDDLSATQRRYLDRVRWLMEVPAAWKALRENIDHFYNTAKQMEAPGDRVVAATPEDAKDLREIAELLQAYPEAAERIRDIIDQSREFLAAKPARTKKTA